MQLIDIDKSRYRKHLNIVIIGFISSLLIFSLLFGTVLISLFSTVGDSAQLAQSAVDTVTGEQETNFKYNFLGVVLALLANAAILHSVKNHEFFKEIYYVWQIKQLQNLIYRKLTKIKAAGKAGEEKALIILAFYYQSQIQVYQLDDNTITLSSIEKQLQQVKDTITERGLDISAAQFEKSLITSYGSD